MPKYTILSGEITYAFDPRFVNMIFAGVNRVQTAYGVYGPASGRDHRGIDIDTLAGMDATVRSTVSGTVKWARCVAKGAAGWGSTWEWGWFVWIVAADGTQHIFAHMAAGNLRVKEGQRVTAGQPLGVMGKTGNAALDAQAEHVHYEVRNAAGQAIDPAPWCGIPNRQGQTVEEDEIVAISTEGVKMWFGPMSGGDMATFKAALSGRGLAYTESGGKLYTSAAISPGDQTALVKLALDVKNIGYGPVGGGGVSQAEYDMAVRDIRNLEAEIADKNNRLAEAEKALAKDKEITAGAKIEAERQKQRADAAEKILASAKTVRILEE